ncbi:DUF4290 domain-containing protein [Porphyromonas sp. HMSC065F10]|uniref:DUF4290 domain-containing protein n=1 Tax=Porphyromonas sp. HMSC065F10 TaxID=1739394 RepID=UPI0008A22993|nr:DUF4290 domain-containing protein [Porphyromonas sp. HMSC065F10]OFR32450.1 hypothetical protein HMPREF2890_08220 [Porphyromonas sp. HMSC065F10]
MLQDYKENDAKPLILPQYGRNVQNMVDRCVEIEDPATRQQCAETIIDTMRSFATTDKDREDFEQILWDHLYIMSRFRLEVDFPYPVTSREEYEEPVVPRLDDCTQEPPKYRHYGHTIERMVEIVKVLPEGEERDELARITAVEMKRQYCSWNKSSVADSKIFADLYELSKGEVYLDEHICTLPEAGVLTAPTGNNPHMSNNNRKGSNNNRGRGNKGGNHNKKKRR